MLPSGPFPGKWTFFGFYLVSVIIVLLKLRCFGVIGSVYMHACMREKQAESERRRAAWICRRRQPPLFQRCRGETGERGDFRRHIWMCWNSPHARGHPICMLLTSTQPICGRCERRKVTGERKKGGSFINSITTSPVSSSSSSSSSPQSDAAGLLNTALYSVI